MKIYTRTGDDGSTGLFGGDRVPKDDPRIAAYGTVDETNSLVGVARAHLSAADAEADAPAGRSRLDDVLGRLQENLFTVGADLATPLDSKPVVPRIEAAHVERLEADIDAFQNELPELKQFILPGGAPGGATLHTARTVCRRAERLTVRAEAEGDASINPHAAVYLNRLSDLLFVLARWANLRAGAREDRWSPGESDGDNGDSEKGASGGAR
jgi:cob(I)alamin adenosyltransferase